MTPVDEFVEDLISSLRERNKMMNSCAGLSRDSYIKKYGDFLGEQLWIHDLNSLTLIEHELLVKLGSYKTAQIKSQIAQEIYSEKHSPENESEKV